MFKSIMKNVGIVVAQWVIVTILTVAAITGYNKAFAAEKSIGWTIGDQTPAGVQSAYVLGDHGGRLIISCNREINNIEMHYVDVTKTEYTFFSARAYMHGYKEKDASVWQGFGATTTQEVYSFLMTADVAIEIQPYAHGTKEIVHAAMARGDKKAPPLNAVIDGRETFVTTPSVVGVVEGMIKQCPIKGGNATNL